MKGVLGLEVICRTGQDRFRTRTKSREEHAHSPTQEGGTEQDEWPLRRGGGAAREGGGGGFPLAGVSEVGAGLPCILYGGGGGASLTLDLDG